MDLVRRVIRYRVVPIVRIGQCQLIDSSSNSKHSLVASREEVFSRLFFPCLFVVFRPRSLPDA